MKVTALSLEQTPPLSVPLRFFLTAPVFVVAAAIVLLWNGHAALDSRWTPPLLAATHFLTLGFLTMIMAGAIQQLLPVLMASPVPRPRLTSAVIHLVLTLGTLSLGAGMLTGKGGLFLGALVVLGAGLIFFVLMVMFCLFQARSSHATVFVMGLAVIALLVTAGLGILLAAGHGLDSVPLFRTLTDLHLLWGMLGWVGLLVIGVAYQVVPMFQLTPNYPGLLMRWLPRILFAGLSIWGMGLLFPEERKWLQWIGGGGVVGSFAAFSFMTLRLQQQRRRRLSDINIDFWRLALVCLLAAMGLWTAQGFLQLPQTELLLGVLLVAGFAMSVVSGMLYKIVPFLVWLHLNNYMQATGRWGEQIPNMKQILPSQRSRLQFWLQFSALLLLLLAAVWPGPFIRPAALTMLAAFSLLWWNLLDGLRLYYRYIGAGEEG